MNNYKKELLISEIKALNGKINMTMNGEFDGNLEDLNAQIQALTNMLEML